MRVTQSMLTTNFLRNLSDSYQRLAKYQNQLATGQKITRPSDDPVVATLGMEYRTNLSHIEQYKRNLSTAYKWMSSSEDALKEATSIMQRVYELTVQASNGTYDDSQREDIATEIGQLQKQMAAIADTRVAGKYIFNGTNTTVKPTDLSKMPNLETIPALSSVVLSNISFSPSERIAGTFTEMGGVGPLNTDYFAIPAENIDASKNDQVELVIPGKGSIQLNYNNGKFEGYNSGGSYTDAEIKQANIKVTEGDGNYRDAQYEVRLPAVQNPENYVITTQVGDQEYELTYDKQLGYFTNNEEIKTDLPPSELQSFTDIYLTNGKSPVATNSDAVTIEVNNGIEIRVNVDPTEVFNAELFQGLAALQKDLKNGASAETISSYLSEIKSQLDNIVSERAELGARYDRVEMVEKRLGRQKVIASQILSDNEDIDIEKVIMNLKIQESVHRAALAAGARIMQPTLMDFLR